MMNIIANHPLVDKTFINTFLDCTTVIEDLDNMQTYMNSYKVSMDIVESCEGPHPDFPWDAGLFPYINTLSIDFLKRHKNDMLAHTDEKGWETLSRHKSITFDDIITLKEFPWCAYNVSQNPNITEQIVQQNPTYKWDWDLLATQPQISVSFTLKNIDIDTDISESNTKFFKKLLTSNKFNPEQMMGFYTKYDINDINQAVQNYDYKQQIKLETRKIIHKKVNAGKETNNGIGNIILQYV